MLKCCGKLNEWIKCQGACQVLKVVKNKTIWLPYIGNFVPKSNYFDRLAEIEIEIKYSEKLHLHKHNFSCANTRSSCILKIGIIACWCTNIKTLSKHPEKAIPRRKDGKFHQKNVLQAHTGAHASTHKQAHPHTHTQSLSLSPSLSLSLSLSDWN